MTVAGINTKGDSAKVVANNPISNIIRSLLGKISSLFTRVKFSEPFGKMKEFLNRLFCCGSFFSSKEVTQIDSEEEEIDISKYIPAEEKLEKSKFSEQTESAMVIERLSAKYHEDPIQSQLHSAVKAFEEERSTGNILQIRKKFKGLGVQFPRGTATFHSIADHFQVDGKSEKNLGNGYTLELRKEVKSSSEENASQANYQRGGSVEEIYTKNGREIKTALNVLTPNERLFRAVERFNENRTTDNYKALGKLFRKELGVSFSENIPILHSISKHFEFGNIIEDFLGEEPIVTVKALGGAYTLKLTRTIQDSSDKPSSKVKYPKVQKGEPIKEVYTNEDGKKIVTTLQITKLEGYKPVDFSKRLTSI